MIEEVKKVKVGHKEILPYIQALTPVVKELRTLTEKMPLGSGRRKSLLVTIEALEKKTQIMSKEISEEQATSYLNKHPELLQKLAKAARSDEGMKEVAKEVTEGEDITSEEGPKQEHKKKKNRF